MVTATSAKPAEFAGVVTLTDVDVALMPVPETPPKVTPVVLARLVPVMVMVSPPDTLPWSLLYDEITGKALNSYALARVSEPPRVVTTTSTAPTDLAGVVTVTDEAPVSVMVAVVPPKVTAVVEVRLLPEITTVVPPAKVPLLTSRDVSTGAA